MFNASQVYNITLATYLYGQNLKYRCSRMFDLKVITTHARDSVVDVAAVKWAKILP